MSKLFALLLASLLCFSAQADWNGYIYTTAGNIKIRLHAKTPNASYQFIGLASGKKEFITTDGKKIARPFYDGLIFHRVHPDLGIFTGCPWGTGRGWPGFYVEDDEITKKQRFDRPGLIAMAKVENATQFGSQFFITTKPMPRLNGKYDIFGEVIDGMDVVNKIANAPRDVTMKPKKRIEIKHIEIDNQ